MEMDIRLHSAAYVKKTRHIPRNDDKVFEEDEEEIDETFLVLQNLLASLNGVRQHRKHQRAVVPTASSITSTNVTANRSQEELLVARRQERERFRRWLLSKPRRHPIGLAETDEDEDDTPLSAESRISNRVINGSFSHRRRSEKRSEAQLLPVVALPTSGKLAPPTINPKLCVHMTNEHMQLRNQMTSSALDNHETMLSPPLATWSIQMRHLDPITC